MWKNYCCSYFHQFCMSFQSLRNSSYCSYQWFDMQTRQKGQFCFVLTLLPCLCAFLNKEIFDSGLNSNNSCCLFSCSWPRNSREWDELASDVISEIMIFCFSEEYMWTCDNCVVGGFSNTGCHSMKLDQKQEKDQRSGLICEKLKLGSHQGFLWYWVCRYYQNPATKSSSSQIQLANKNTLISHWSAYSRTGISSYEGGRHFERNCFKMQKWTI